MYIFWQRKQTSRKPFRVKPEPRALTSSGLSTCFSQCAPKFLKCCKNMVFIYAKNVIRVQNEDVDVSLGTVKEVRGHCLYATFLNSGYKFVMQLWPQYGIL